MSKLGIRLLSEEVADFDATIQDVTTPTESDAATALEVLSNVVDSYQEVNTTAVEAGTVVENIRLRNDMRVLKLAAEGVSEKRLLITQSEGVMEVLKKVGEIIKKIFEAIVNFFKSLIGKVSGNVKKFKQQSAEIDRFIKDNNQKHVTGENWSLTLNKTKFHLVAWIAAFLMSPTSYNAALKCEVTKFGKNFEKLVDKIKDGTSGDADLKVVDGKDMPAWVTDLQTNGPKVNITDSNKENINKILIYIASDLLSTNVKKAESYEALSKDYPELLKMISYDSNKDKMRLQERLSSTEAGREGYITSETKKYTAWADVVKVLGMLPGIAYGVNLTTYETNMDRMKSKAEEALNDAKSAVSKIDGLKTSTENGIGANAAKFTGSVETMNKVVGTINALLSTGVLASAELMGKAFSAAIDMKNEAERLLKDKGVKTTDENFTATEEEWNTIGKAIQIEVGR